MPVVACTHNAKKDCVLEGLRMASCAASSSRTLQRRGELLVSRDKCVLKRKSFLFAAYAAYRTHRTNYNQSNLRG